VTDTDTQPEADWLDKLYDPDSGDTFTTAPDDEPDEEPTGGPSRWWSRPTSVPAEGTEPQAGEQPRRPVRAVVPARALHYSELHPRTRGLLYNGLAALAGWGLALTRLFGDVITQCAQHAGIRAALILGVAMIVVIGQFWDRRTRGWYGPLAWVCRIPLASAVVALGLYAPGRI
jgi:hypothetical protein